MRCESSPPRFISFPNAPVHKSSGIRPRATAGRAQKIRACQSTYLNAKRERIWCLPEAVSGLSDNATALALAYALSRRSRTVTSTDGSHVRAGGGNLRQRPHPLVGNCERQPAL